MNNSEYIEVEKNVSLNIRDWGVGKTIVFIPGWPLSYEMYEYQFTQLPQQGYRCVGISLRGFGKSSQPYGVYNYDVFADDIKVVLEALDLHDVTLVGFSMGGAIALHYMARHKGERVSNLALCGAAAPSFTTRPGFPFGLEPGAVDSLIELCYSDRAKLNADFGKIFFRSENSVGPLGDWFQAMGMEASPLATAACLIALRDTDLRADMPKVNVPTAIFHGVHDKVCLFALAEALSAPREAIAAGLVAMAAGAEAISAEAETTAGGIRGAKLIRFENSGHALFFEEKNKFNIELMNFIEKKESREKVFFPL